MALAVLRCLALPEALEAVSKYGMPTYFNADQDHQFMRLGFTDALKEKGIQISMEGKGWAGQCFRGTELGRA